MAISSGIACAQLIPFERSAMNLTKLFTPPTPKPPIIRFTPPPVPPVLRLSLGGTLPKSSFVPNVKVLGVAGIQTQVGAILSSENLTLKVFSPSSSGITLMSNPTPQGSEVLTPQPISNSPVMENASSEQEMNQSLEEKRHELLEEILEDLDDFIFDFEKESNTNFIIIIFKNYERNAA